MPGRLTPPMPESEADAEKRPDADNLLGIINEVLDFSKIEAGKLVLESIPFNLRDLLQDTLTMLAPAAHEKQLELVSLIYRDTPLALRGDPLRLKQVLTNLVGNGVATLVVAKWCKQLDESTLQRELAEGGKSTSLEGLREAA